MPPISPTGRRHPEFVIDSETQHSEREQADAASSCLIAPWANMLASARASRARFFSALSRRSAGLNFGFASRSYLRKAPPDLLQQIKRLRKNGWKIERRPVDGPIPFIVEHKRIVVDPRLAQGDHMHLAALARQVGYASDNTPISVETKEAFVQSVLRRTASGTWSELQVRHHMLQKPGGKDIWAERGSEVQPLTEIHAEYLRNGDEESAKQQIVEALRHMRILGGDITYAESFMQKYDAFQIQGKLQIERELAELNRPQFQSKVDDEYMPLGGYLLARSAVKRPIDDKDDLRNLRDGQRTLVDTQSSFPMRRANIVDDLERSQSRSVILRQAQINFSGQLHDAFYKRMKNEELNETEAKLLKCWPDNYIEELRSRGLDDCQIENSARLVAFAASAMLGGAGACTELSVHAAVLHTLKLEPGQVATTVGSAQEDHMWAEIVNSDGRRRDNDVVIDPWVEDWHAGAAVLREDACYPRLDDIKNFMNASEFAERLGWDDTLKVFAILKSNTEALEIFNGEVEKQAGFWLPIVRDNIERLRKENSEDPTKTGREGIYLDTERVLDEGFQTEVREGLAKLKEGSALQQEIVATGIARNLGVPLRSAATNASHNFESFSSAAEKLVVDKTKTTPEADMD